eukprot:g4788.t1
MNSRRRDLSCNTSGSSVGIWNTTAHEFIRNSPRRNLIASFSPIKSNSSHFNTFKDSTRQRNDSFQKWNATQDQSQSQFQMQSQTPLYQSQPPLHAHASPYRQNKRDGMFRKSIFYDRGHDDNFTSGQPNYQTYQSAKKGSLLSTFTRASLSNIHHTSSTAIEEEKHGVANLWQADEVQDRKIKNIQSQHKKLSEEFRIDDAREAMRVFRKRMRDKSENALKVFQYMKQNSGSDDFLIDFEEFKRCMDSTGMNLSALATRSLFDKFDKDGSGEIDFNEFTRKIQQQEETPLTTSRHPKVTDMLSLKQKRKNMLNAADFGAVDLDGDGVIDADEIRLAKYIKNIKGHDVDGDGIISEQERLQAQQMAGRYLLMNEYAEKYKGQMHVFGGPDCADKSDAEMVELLANAENFAYVLKGMTAQSKMLDLKSSKRFIKQWGIQHPDQVNSWKKEYVKDRNAMRNSQRDEILKQTEESYRTISMKKSKLQAFLKEHTGHSRFTNSFAMIKK